MKHALKKWMSIGLIVSALAGGNIARGQYWVTDPVFAPAVEGYTGLGGAVSARPYSGGKVLVETSYSMINGVVLRIAPVRLNPDGSIDSSFAAPERISVLAVYPNGKVLVGSHPQDGYSTLLIRRLLADGSVDSTFAATLMNYDFLNTELLADGRILVYGQFTTVDGVNRSGLALLLANGGLDASFQSPFPANTQSEVINAARPTADGLHVIVAGGNFQLGTGLNSVIRLNLDGSIDGTFNVTGINYPGYVSRVYPDASGGGVLVADGSGGIGHLTSTGAADLGFVPALPGSNRIFGPQQADGKIYYLTVDYASGTGAYQRQLRRMNLNGSDDATFPVIATQYSSANEINLPTVVGDGTLFVGPVTPERDSARLELSHILADGSIDPNFSPRFGRFGSVVAHVRQSDGKYLIAGNFDHIKNSPVAGSPSQVLVRLDSTGAIDPSFNAPLGAGTDISEITIQPSGKILLRGSFPNINGGETVIRLKADGSIDSSFPAFSHLTYARAIDSAGYIYAYTGESGAPLRRYTPDGVLDPSFQDPQLQGLAGVSAPLADGALLVLTTQGYGSYALTRLLHSGAVDPNFTPPDATNLVGLAALPDGNAIVCEEKYAPLVAGSRYHTVSRMLPSGTVDYTYISPVTPGTGPRDDIRLALAGAVFDLVRAASPGAEAFVTLSLLQSDEQMALTCGTNGQLVIRSSSQYDNSLQAYQRTSLTSPSMDAAPANFSATSPAPRIALLNGAFAASADVSGLGSFSYQWRKNGVAIPGATSSFLHIRVLQAGDAGDYTAVVSNAYGSVTTPPATLSVDSDHTLAAIVTQPTSQAAVHGGNVTFSVGATGDLPLDYQWSRNDVPIAGATGASLTLVNVQPSDAGVYTVVVRNSVNTTHGFYGGAAASQAASLIVTELAGTPSRAADFNGDGKPDLIWSNSQTGERALWLMNGTNFLAASTLGNFPLEWTIAATGDFNGDGKPDIVWSNSITGERALWLMDGTNLLAVSTLGIFPPEWTVAATGDFNGDGKPDIVWSNSVTGERALWLMDGTTRIGVSTLGVFPLEWTVAATGDFNGDGKPDLVWSNSLTGERALWLMDGTTRIGVSTLGVFPLEWTVAGTADFNGDGKPDIIWSNSVTGERALWLMDGTTFLAASTLGLFPLEWTVSN